MERTLTGHTKTSGGWIWPWGLLPKITYFPWTEPQAQTDSRSGPEPAVWVWFRILVLSVTSLSTQLEFNLLTER